MHSKIVKAIVTGFYIGLIPIAPGTMGSLLAFPLCIGLLKLAAKLELRISISAISIAQQELLAIITLLLFVCALLFILGTYLVNIYIQDVNKEDPKEVVIDEIAGQMLTILLSCLTNIFAHNSALANKFSVSTIDFIFLFLMPFVFFRLFDIFKPWPINWIDQNVKGGLGVMLDDILAAFFAAIMCYTATFIIIN